MNFRDTLERLFWTLLSAFLGALAVGQAFDLSTIEAGLTAAAGAGVNFLLLVARSRLAVLPEPGDGLPGVPTDAGQAYLPMLLVFVVGFILGALCYANGIIVG